MDEQNIITTTHVYSKDWQMSFHATTFIRTSIYNYFQTKEKIFLAGPFSCDGRIVDGAGTGGFFVPVPSDECEK